MNDLKFACRQLLKNPGFAAVAVLTLALGIMSTTAMYSVIRAVVLDPFPYKDVDNLMSVKVWDPGQQGYRTYYSTDVRHLDSGATELKDARTGKEVRVQTSEVEKITKEEFETGKAEPTTRPM